MSGPYASMPSAPADHISSQGVKLGLRLLANDIGSLSARHSKIWHHLLIRTRKGMVCSSVTLQWASLEKHCNNCIDLRVIVRTGLHCCCGGLYCKIAALTRREIVKTSYAVGGHGLLRR